MTAVGGQSAAAGMTRWIQVAGIAEFPVLLVAGTVGQLELQAAGTVGQPELQAAGIAGSLRVPAAETAGLLDSVVAGILVEEVLGTVVGSVGVEPESTQLAEMKVEIGVEEVGIEEEVAAAGAVVAGSAGVAAVAG